jgi:hypothetical protein
VTGRIVPIGGRATDDRRRRRQVEAAMREALDALVAGLHGSIDLDEAVHGANRALAGAVVEVCKSRIA